MDSRTAALSSVDVLIEAVGRGSPVALKRLYELESRRLYGIALRIVRRLSDDPALGDEAVEPDVIEKLDVLAQAGALQRCLKLLDDEQRRCILLAFVDGLSHSQIAERIKAPLGSVKSWIRRGLLSLRRCLQ